MYYSKQRNHIIPLLLLNILMNTGLCFALSEEARAKGFVYLHEVDPTILISVRYYSDENFVGRPIDGYKSATIILTKPAAEALKRVQEIVNKDGYSLVIYDGYRPQQAPDHFMRWSTDVADQLKKFQYYPRINKADVFKLGYVAERSGHSRGSTVDLTLIKLENSLHPIVEKTRTLLDGSTIIILDDGTVDMGSSFDLLDEASHYKNDLIADEFKHMRLYLKGIMEKNGFKGCSVEWWHFTLKNEPYPADQDSSYFNFDVE